MFLSNFLNEDYELKSKAILLCLYFSLSLLLQTEAYILSKVIVLRFCLSSKMRIMSESPRL